MSKSEIKDISIWSKSQEKSYKILKTIRIIGLLLMISTYVIEIILVKTQIFFNQFRYMTYWGMGSTLIYFIKVTLIDERRNCWVNVNSKYNLLLLGLNPSITIFYFAFLFKPSPTFDLNQYSSMTIHFFPMFLTYLEFSFNNTKVYYSHVWIGVVFLVCYIPANLISTLLDKPVYDIIDYKSINTLYYLVAVIILVLMNELVAMLYQSFVKKWILKCADFDYNHSSNFETVGSEMSDYKPLQNIGEEVYPL